MTTNAYEIEKAEWDRKQAEEDVKNLDPDLVSTAVDDLKILLGRNPTPDEVSKFLQDMPNSPVYQPDRRALAKAAAKERAAKAEASESTEVPQDVVDKAVSDLKTKLGREPTA